MNDPMSLASRAFKARAEWLEDVLAGLMACGVRQDEIDVQEFPDELKTRVAVRGVVKYEWAVNVHVMGLTGKAE